ncbi:BQ5605_C009g05729 [Microbotryum silenes-dioicae]|uniref:BQ5605_C009g05729 protein n=1 Tax=Microbotryum silenes-dioicae TaxID=796604 RepID=A0A2X0PFZ0_9BASI|nr:BQ5605_C009g05729 [Microbotryum silenes-dioicae]
MPPRPRPRLRLRLRLPPSPSTHQLINSPLHRIPTLWSLYRPLLRLSSVQIHPAIESGVLRAYVKREFRRSTKLTGRDKIGDKLRKGYELLDLLETQSTSPNSSARLHSLIEHISLSKPHKILTPPPPPLKPRLTRGILQAQPYHPPLPRLKPQPWRLGAMIHERRKKIAKRWLESEQVKIWSEDGRDEDRFERDVLQGGEGEGSVKGKGRGEEQVWAREWSDLWETWKGKAQKETMINEIKTPKEMQDRATRVAKISGRARAGYGTIDPRRTGENSAPLESRKTQGPGGG